MTRLYETRNSTGREWCGHCHGAGLVFMDDASGGAEPCPMCEVGRINSGIYAADARTAKQVAEGRHRQMRNRDGRAVSQPDYYHLVAVSALSWERGLTLEHRHFCSRIGCRTMLAEPNVRCVDCDPERETKRVPQVRSLSRRIAQPVPAFAAEAGLA